MEWANSMSALVVGIAQSKSSVESKTEIPVTEEVVVIESTPQETVQLDGNRWYVRKASNLTEPVVITPEALNQAVAIEDSKKIAIKVNGKINAVLADKCQQLDLEVGDVVSSIELLGCAKVRLFLTGEVHVVVLDGCEAVQVFISAPSLAVKVVTSKCSEINILTPANLLNPSLTGDEANDYTEMAVPEQFFTTITDGKLVTAPHEHVGV
jgi:adenylyl cyclase-associated protein